MICCVFAPDNPLIMCGEEAVYLMAVSIGTKPTRLATILYGYVPICEQHRLSVPKDAKIARLTVRKVGDEVPEDAA